ncbi:MAG: hypothetical protein WAK93_04265 [Solirubrobacteraceae bacterium]
MANTETRTEKGVSLARGPALILGTILLAAGLYFLYKQHFFPPFSNFPNGTPVAKGKVLGLFEANGWTGMLTAVAGGLLLFGAAQHLLAKTMSLIVGVALGAAAVIALISGNVLGMAAANGWTELGWGIAAAILLLNTLIPRRRHTVETYDDRPAGRRVGRGRTATAAGAGAAGGTAVGAHEGRKEERAADADAADREGANGPGRDDRTVMRNTEGGAAGDRDANAEPVGGRESYDAPEQRVRSTDDPE